MLAKLEMAKMTNEINDFGISEGKMRNGNSWQISNPTQYQNF